MRVRRFVCLTDNLFDLLGAFSVFYLVSNTQFPPPSHSAEECGQTDNSALMPPFAILSINKSFFAAKLNEKQDKQALFIEEDRLDATVNIVIICILKRLRGINNNKSASDLMLL